VRQMRLLAAMLAAAVVTAGLTACSASPPAARTVRLARNLTVTLPPGSPPVTATPSGARVKEPRLTMLAPAERLTAAGKLPAGGAVLTFHVKAPAGTTPFLASFDKATGQWVPVPSRYDPRTGAVSARLPHFSVWAPLDWISSEIVPVLKGAFLSIFGFGSSGEYPQCSSYDVSVTDSHPAGTEVGACAQMAGDGEAMVHLGNLRPYIVDVTYPYSQASQPSNLGASSVSYDHPDLFVQLWAGSAAKGEFLLSGFGDASIDLPLPHSVKITTRLDGEAFRAAMMELALRTAAQLTRGTADKMVRLADQATCVHDFLDQARHRNLTLQWAQSSGAAAFGCVASFLKKDSKPDILVGAVILAASLIVGVISAGWSAIDKAMGNADHVLSLTPPNAASMQPTAQVWIDPTQAPLSGATPAFKPVNVELAGDGTYELQNMTWQTWSGTEAIGTGTAHINDCSSTCAGGHWYDVPVRADFSRPVHDCTAQYGQGTTVSGGARYWWSQVNLTYPAGLPAALSGSNRPYGLWLFTELITWAHQSCTSLSALGQ
jgi:hypothetical protein